MFYLNLSKKIFLKWLHKANMAANFYMSKQKAIVFFARDFPLEWCNESIKGFKPDTPSKGIIEEMINAL